MTDIQPAAKRATATISVRMAVHGTVIERHEVDDVLNIIESRLRMPNGGSLALGSVNLDHLHHFGTANALKHQPGLEWMLLADGMPIAWRGQMLTSRPWPRVTGADLLPRLLEAAARSGHRVGFLGGTRQTHELLSQRLAEQYPNLAVSGMWSPDRAELDNDSKAIAGEIRAADTDILVVCLGKPRQEEWVAKYGRSTRAKLLLPFGASVDFLVGTKRRAPDWMQRVGLEWFYRLSREPRRLARRYLIQGPAALIHLWRADVTSSAMVTAKPIHQPRLSAVVNQAASL